MKKIKCLECGKFFIKPLAHCWQKHGISAREYKKLHGLDLKKGLIPEEHKQLLRESAIKNKMPERLKKAGAKTRFKKGHNVIYKRSPQTMERLRKHIKTLKGGRPPMVEKIKISCALCGKQKEIYPRHYQKNNNYCGVRCRNISNNKKWQRKEKRT